MTLDSRGVDQALEARRRFLTHCGKFAIVTPPAVSILLAAGRGSYAVAASGLGNGGGNGGGGGGGDSGPGLRSSGAQGGGADLNSPGGPGALEQRRRSRNIIDMLMVDHQAILDMADTLALSAGADVGDRLRLVERIEQRIRAHRIMESEILMPAFVKAGGAEPDDESQDDMEAMVLRDLKRTDLPRERIASRARVFQELIEEHIRGEEQHLFPEAREIMSVALLEDLGTQVEFRMVEMAI